MRVFQDKRAQRRVAFSWLTLVAVLIVLFLIARAVYNVYPKYKLSLESKNSIQIEKENLELRRSQIEADISKLSSKSGEEAELRTKFQISRPGESVIVIVGKDASTTSSEKAVRSNQSESGGMFYFIKNLFRK